MQGKAQHDGRPLDGWIKFETLVLSSPFVDQTTTADVRILKETL